MKEVGFAEFAAMPPGTVFCMIDDGHSPPYRGLYRKEATIEADGAPCDFFMIPLTPQPYPGFDSLFVKERWGEFDYGVRYGVLEEADLADLHVLLGRP